MLRRGNKPKRALPRSGGPQLHAFARRTLRTHARGFTLLELMIVLSVMMILMAVAVPMYQQHVVQAR